MFGLGSGELLVVAALALILIGPKRLPEVATYLGRLVRKAKRVVDELKTDLEK